MLEVTNSPLSNRLTDKVSYRIDVNNFGKGGRGHLTLNYYGTNSFINKLYSLVGYFDLKCKYKAKPRTKTFIIRNNYFHRKHIN